MSILSCDKKYAGAYRKALAIPFTLIGAGIPRDAGSSTSPAGTAALAICARLGRRQPGKRQKSGKRAYELQHLGEERRSSDHLWCALARQ